MGERMLGRCAGAVLPWPKEVVVNVAIYGLGPWRAVVGGPKSALDAVFQFTLPADGDKRP